MKCVVTLFFMVTSLKMWLACVNIYLTFTAGKVPDKINLTKLIVFKKMYHKIEYCFMK